MAPKFERSSYDAPSILETANSGTPIVIVTATDGDPEVKVYLNIKYGWFIIISMS